MQLGSKTKRQQLITIRIGTALVVLIIILFGFSVVKRFSIAHDMAERRASVEAEKSRLEARRAELQEKVQYMKEDQSIEAEIRRNFDVAKEGETVVVIVDDAPQEEPEEPAEPPVATTTPWYQFWR